jgi:hypothetical protein
MSVVPRSALVPRSAFEEILDRYGSDHNNTGTDKNTNHPYGPLYGRLFAPIRERARRVLEVGVYSGASVVCLAEFFEGARVVGVDITLDRVAFGRDHPRVTLERADATSEAELHAAVGDGPYDLILDDASHLKSHQLSTFRLLAPSRLARTPGAMYVIEDIKVGTEVGEIQEFQRFQRELSSEAARLGFYPIEWYDMRRESGLQDDVVAVIRSGTPL